MPGPPPHLFVFVGGHRLTCNYRSNYAGVGALLLPSRKPLGEWAGIIPPLAYYSYLKYQLISLSLSLLPLRKSPTVVHKKTFKISQTQQCTHCGGQRRAYQIDQGPHQYTLQEIRCIPSPALISLGLTNYVFALALPRRAS